MLSRELSNCSELHPSPMHPNTHAGHEARLDRSGLGVRRSCASEYPSCARRFYSAVRRRLKQTGLWGCRCVSWSSDQDGWAP
jgi:hypothetical protein